MSKYLFHGSYTPEGLIGLRSEGGTHRVEAARQALRSVGGTLEGFYFALGDDDFFTIVDLPGNVNAAALSMVANMSGAFTIRTVALLTPEELDEAIATGVEFNPPGAAR